MNADKNILVDLITSELDDDIAEYNDAKTPVKQNGFSNIDRHSNTEGEYCTNSIKNDDGVAALKHDTQTPTSKTCIDMTHERHSLPIFQPLLSLEDPSSMSNPNLREFVQRNEKNPSHTFRTIHPISAYRSHFFQTKRDDGWSCGYRNLQNLVYFLTQLPSYPEFRIRLIRGGLVGFGSQSSSNRAHEQKLKKCTDLRVASILELQRAVMRSWSA
mmetsp:Transcript_63273/g.74060  ORF Transcript_63273/g.74060 Transcript_63273/m.74060 type:complete len:215 (-) Transcript_63273:1529-2173(-)